MYYLHTQISMTYQELIKYLRQIEKIKIFIYQNLWY